MHPSTPRGRARWRGALLLLLAAALLLVPGPASAHIPAELQAPLQTAAPRVGLQVGHWKIAQLPASLARLRGDTGTYGGGRSEVDLNMDIAQRTAVLLQNAGVQVDILPAPVPTGYQADAFVAIHADGSTSRLARGYKIATRWRSGVGFRDATLVDLLGAEYGAMTGLPHDQAVTRNMRGYYAFNTWLGDEGRISDFTPAAIIETGYMTNAADRAVLFNNTATVAAGIARGVLRFLNTGAADSVQAHAEAVAAASPTGRSVIVLEDGVNIRAANSSNAPIVGQANRGDVLLYLDTTVRPHGPFINLHGSELAVAAGFYRVGMAGTSTPVYISRDMVIVQQPHP